MKETWKPILGYNGRYLVSNYGNIKSMIHKDYPNGTLMSPATQDIPTKLINYILGDAIDE